MDSSESTKLLRKNLWTDSFMRSLEPDLRRNNPFGGMVGNNSISGIGDYILQPIHLIVAAISRVFNITDEEVLKAVVNESNELAHICELYKYKMVS